VGFRYSQGVAAAELAAPHLAQHAQPVLAHDLADSRLGPARPFHRGRQIGKIADAADAFGIHDLAELHQPAGVALVSP